MKTKNIIQIAFAIFAAAAVVSCSSGSKVNEKPSDGDKLVQWHPEAVPSDEIHFQTTTGNPMTPYETSDSYFGANFISASYTGKTGILKFDGEITKVGMQALRDNDGTDGTFVTQLKLPESVTQIAMAAFQTCWYLKKLTILGEVTQFGYGAFDRNNSLEEIYCKASVPPAFEYNIKPSGSDMPSLKHIYVPRASVDAYKSAWDFAADVIEGYDF